MSTDASIIVDRRSIICFKNVTFSNYATKDVIKELTTKLASQHINLSQHWAAELICSGATSQLFDIIMDNFCIHINVSNPRLPGYFLQRFGEVKKRIVDLSKVDPLQVRNDPIVRTVFCEIIGVLCLSSQKKLITKPRIPAEDLTLEGIARRRRLTSATPAAGLFRTGDPTECLSPINELYDAMIRRDTGRTIYWIYWLWDWDAARRRAYGSNVCVVRGHDTIPAKLATDVIWLIYEVIMLASTTLPSDAALAPRACLELYKKEYCESGSIIVRRKRLPLIQIAAQFVAERPPLLPLVINTGILSAMTRNVNNLYVEIKKQTADLVTAVAPEGCSVGEKKTSIKKKADVQIEDASIKNMDLLMALEL